MRKLLNNVIIKKIIISLVLIVMTTNFVIPNIAYASTLWDLSKWLFGDPVKKLINSVFYLLSYIGDAVMSVMQNIMVGDRYLKSGGEWSIKYSPGKIFANQVAGLKVNFITATEEDNEDVLYTHNPGSTEEMYDLITEVSEYMRNHGRS